MRSYLRFRAFEGNAVAHLLPIVASLQYSAYFEGLVADGVRRPVQLRILGEHHVMNALAAIAAAGELGVSLPDAVARLETVEIAERWRMQPLGSDRVRIINDAYNASPDSMAAALRTLAQITEPGQRKVAVLGAMSELGEAAGEEHDRVGLQAVRLRMLVLQHVSHFG